MKNVGNVLRMKIEKMIHKSYEYQKDTKYKHRLSEKVGKYHYIIDDNYSIIRIIPLKDTSRKNWITQPKSKLTPYYELMIDQENLPKFWHLNDALKYLQDYYNGKVKLWHEDDHFDN